MTIVAKTPRQIHFIVVLGSSLLSPKSDPLLLGYRRERPWPWPGLPGSSRSIGCRDPEVILEEYDDEGESFSVSSSVSQESLRRNGVFSGSASKLWRFFCDEGARSYREGARARIIFAVVMIREWRQLTATDRDKYCTIWSVGGEASVKGEV